MSSERGGGKMRKFWTLLKKDLWASAQDKMVLMMFFCPIVLAILFRAAIYGPWLILMAVTVLNMVLAPLCTCPLLIAAEKEQGTLPLLRRSKVRGGEVYRCEVGGSSSYRNYCSSNHISDRRGRQSAAGRISSSECCDHDITSSIWAFYRCVRKRSEQPECISHTGGPLFSMCCRSFLCFTLCSGNWLDGCPPDFTA